MKSEDKDNHLLVVEDPRRQGLYSKTATLGNSEEWLRLLGLVNWSLRILEDKDLPRGQQHCDTDLQAVGSCFPRDKDNDDKDDDDDYDNEDHNSNSDTDDHTST